MQPTPKKKVDQNMTSGRWSASRRASSVDECVEKMKGNDWIRPFLSKRSSLERCGRTSRTNDIQFYCLSWRASLAPQARMFGISQSGLYMLLHPSWVYTFSVDQTMFTVQYTSMSTLCVTWDIRTCIIWRSHMLIRSIIWNEVWAELEPQYLPLCRHLLCYKESN